MIKTSETRPQGPALKPTALDERKAAADFRITCTDGGESFIVWRDGRREWVKDRQLAKLQDTYDWVCDF